MKQYRTENIFFKRYNKKAIIIDYWINNEKYRKRAKIRYLIIQAYIYKNNNFLYYEDFKKFRTTKKTNIEKLIEDILKDVLYINNF